MELGERLVSGSGFGELFDSPLFGIGIVVQLGIAAIGAVLLRWIWRVAVRIADALARPPRRRPAGMVWVRAASSRNLRPAFAGTPVGSRSPTPLGPLPHRRNAAWLRRMSAWRNDIWEVDRYVSS